MSKEMELLLKRERAYNRQSLLYELLGEYGDDIPLFIQSAMRLRASLEYKEYISLGNKIKSRIEITE